MPVYVFNQTELRDPMLNNACIAMREPILVHSVSISIPTSTSTSFPVVMVIVLPFGLHE